MHFRFFTAFFLLFQHPSLAQDTLRFDWFKSGRATHEALLIPANFGAGTDTYFFQLDTGSPYSMVYREKIAHLPNCPDSFFSCQHAFTLGEFKMVSFHSENDDSLKQGDIIGTLGTDFFKNRIVEFNYPQQLLVLADELPNQELSNWCDLGWFNGSLLLKATIGSKEGWLYFDTGSSAVDLLIDSAQAVHLAVHNAAPQKKENKSWNRIITTYTYPSNAEIQLGNSVVKLNSVGFATGASTEQVNRMRAMGISGLVGNKLFLQHRLLLDLKHKKMVLW